MHGRTPPHYYVIWGGYLPIKMLLYIAMTHAWAYPPQLLRHMGKYLPIKMLLYIAMTHAWAYPPPTITSYRGVPANQNVTIYSDDSCMGVPPHYYVIWGGYLSIIMLLFIAMTHAGCGLKLCSVTKNSDDKLCSPLSET